MLKKIFLSLFTISTFGFSPLLAQEETDSITIEQPIDTPTFEDKLLEASNTAGISSVVIDRFKPHSISSEINSPYQEINPIMSPDGKTLYFIRANHPENYFGKHSSQDIWYSELQSDGIWSEAKRLVADFNKGRYNSILSVSNDGKHYLVTGRYSKKNSKRIKRGLSIVIKENGGWSKPLTVKVPKFKRKNKGVSSNAYMVNESDLIFLNYTKKWEGKKLDIFYSLAKNKDNYKWKRPKKMKRNVRKRFKSMETPYFDTEDSTLYFSAYKKGRANKFKYDMYKTSPLDAKLKYWSDPIKLSDTLNISGWDAYFRKIKEGYWAIYSTEKQGNSDIFWVKLKEENPFVHLTGFVKNSETDEAFNKPFKFIVDGKVVDSVTIYESGAYSVKLPLGSTYEILTESDYYNSTPIKIDVSDQREFIEIQKDLILTPFPYVIVSGTVLNTKTDKILADRQFSKIVVDGIIIDSVVIKDGKFDVKLKWGEKYKLQAIVNEFDPIPATIDLTMVNEYQELTTKLYVTPLEKFALLTGKVLNKKTNKPLNINFTINVDDAKSISSKIDTINGTYEIKLSLGRETMLTAGAHKFFPISEVIDLTNETGNVKVIKDLYLSPLVVGENILLNNIFFEHGKDVLKPESFKDIDRVIDLLRDYKEMKIEIGGHTDDKGHLSFNRHLSEDRAKAVTDYIISKGIPAERITSKGYGESTPITTNKTEEGRAKNRRVEFTVLEQ